MDSDVLQLAQEYYDGKFRPHALYRCSIAEAIGSAGSEQECRDLEMF
jgi:hypothetical protein